MKILATDSKEYYLFSSLLKYYDNKINHDAFVEVLQDSSMISLRMIDWFVTKYSKKNNINYEINGKTFEVYTNYKSQLKVFSKKSIDPFCRRDRLVLDKHSVSIVTTIGQMNFFKWAIDNGVLKYICDNFEILEKEMKSYSKNENEKRKLKKNSNINKLDDEAIISDIKPPIYSAVISFD